MKIGFYLAHPAHFHLFKNVIAELRKNNQVFVCYNKKDVLHDLIIHSDFADISIEVKANKNISGKIGLIIQFFLKIFGAYRIFKKQKADIIIGTPILISLLGKILPYKSIIVNEDDYDAIKKTAALGYPHANHIVAPRVCVTRFDDKTIKYESYHELAYLHPNHFTPDKKVVEKYFSPDQPYFIIRFVKLVAHHDEGIRGINTEVALKITELLAPHGKIYITSERELEKELEQYRININPKDIHHVMAFSSLYIGDSQTMAAEAGVLGVPFIRFNDFVGRISYLDELENVYQLGYGIKPENVNQLYTTITRLINTKNLKEEFAEKRNKMLSEKVDLAKLLTWLFQNYPQSAQTMKEDPQYQYRFK
ncbi:MAG: hypothetical protein AB7G44_00745 [Bacteroidia bacterium]